ncbi:MAG: alginate export family protein [Nitrosospira sp.]|nr:alginate export family protein [Nitrosospira sp.]
MGLMQDGNQIPGAIQVGAGQIDREIHAPALRGYGKIGNTELDYDFNLIYQFGRNGGQEHEAHAHTTELGYTFKHNWKPRISAFYGYATGDRNPNDNVNNRFERFFGAGRPWQADNYIVFENIKTPKIRLEFQPLKDLRIDGAYSWFWLASDTDRFRNLFRGGTDSNGEDFSNRDATGNSGDFIGHAFDVRARYKLTDYIDTTVGYSHFVSGEFTRNRQIAALGNSPGSSDFFYVQVVVSAFK